MRYKTPKLRDTAPRCASATRLPLAGLIEARLLPFQGRKGYPIYICSISRSTEPNGKG